MRVFLLLSMTELRGLIPALLVFTIRIDPPFSPPEPRECLLERFEAAICLETSSSNASALWPCCSSQYAGAFVPGLRNIVVRLSVSGIDDGKAHAVKVSCS
jgi:hypothetical protein